MNLTDYEKLIKFLLARIAEREATARRVLAHEADLLAIRPVAVEYRWVMLYGGSSGFHHGAPSPARVLAECERDLRIVEYAHRAAIEGDGMHFIGYRAAMADVLAALALPDADHPDYDEGWRL